MPHGERVARRKAFVGKLLEELYRHERKDGIEIVPIVALMSIYQAQMFGYRTKIQGLISHFGFSHRQTAAFAESLRRHGVIEYRATHDGRHAVVVSARAKAELDRYFDNRIVTANR